MAGNLHMDLLGFYPSLKGSHGQIRLRLQQQLLDQLCVWIESQMPDKVQRVRVSPSGPGRFRIVATLSNPLYHWFGQLFLHVLGERGIEIHIERKTASPGKPFQGRLSTTMFGRAAIVKIIDSINEGLKAGNVIGVESELFGHTRVTLDPFPLLQKYLPAGMGDHLTLVQWQATYNAFFVDFNWHHAD
jgi:hypothetical protein